MPITITMPALSPTMTEGNLSRWLKKEGEKVSPGDVIAEIETDKATMEVEATDEGILGKILVPEGTEGVPVNTPIALLLEEGEDPSVLEQAAPGGAPAAPPPTAEAPAPAAPTPPAEARSTPSAAAPVAPTAASAPAPEGERIFASPLARRMAERAGIDLRTIRGSGPHGRIVKADVERAIAARVEVVPSERAPTPAPAAAPAAAPAGAYEEIPLSTMRKVIAKRLTEAKRDIPHFYLTIDCVLDPLLDLRKRLNERPGAEYKLSVNDFVIKAVALAIREVPDVNASWGGDRIYRYRDIDISVAVAIPGGLITPIVRKADQKGLATISAEMKEMAARAREGKLLPEEYQGGGFSISNLGMYGIREFAAVINPPQACILAVGAGEKRPVVRDGALAVATVMTVTLSVDHRVVDGALGARFLQAFKALVEDPLALLL
ncbi:MAG TPA: pyruvate dehydrogenase complex dihydrolipoamide acetyltransferase [Rhodospirillales bacterium]|nr:pyruvate dehydrogenase complex dihydrolipoamide acetyltransferase [Rhodospirillales bacterium]